MYENDSQLVNRFVEDVNRLAKSYPIDFSLKGRYKGCEISFTTKPSSETHKHNFYAVSPMLYDVEGCFGAICIECGHLSCMCSVPNEEYDKAFSRDVNGNYIGDKFFKKFHRGGM